MRHKKLDGRRSFLKQLSEQGIELDQRLRSALELYPLDPITDDQIILGLYRLNSIVSRHLNIQDEHLGLHEAPARDVESLKPVSHPAGRRVFDRALEIVGPGRVLGTHHFIQAVLENAMQYGEYFSKRPYFVDMLSRALGRPDTEPLSKSPRLRRLIEELRRSVDGTEDYQYFLALENDRVVFRVSSILDDYVQASDSGLVVPQRAILTHFKDQFAGFSTDEIEELEQLLDDPKASEQDFQRFFERHSHFFRKWDYRQVYPQVYLSRGKSPLVPDFILTDRRLQKAAIIDLKLPRPKLVRRQRNRDRFSAAVMEARTQLLRYRDWFRDPSNRQYLKDKLGMEVYEPHLAVVIGRSSEFSDAFERQQLAADNRDIEIVTYDDMLSFAERRRLILKWDVPQKAQGHSLI